MSQIFLFFFEKQPKKFIYSEKSVHKFVNINYYSYLCPRKVNEV